jgi:hypothetical protein
VGWFDLVSRFARIKIQRQLGLSPAALCGTSLVPFVGEEVFEGCQEEGAKPPPGRIGPGDRLFFE